MVCCIESQNSNRKKEKNLNVNGFFEREVNDKEFFLQAQNKIQATKSQFKFYFLPGRKVWLALCPPPPHQHRQGCCTY